LLASESYTSEINKSLYVAGKEEQVPVELNTVKGVVTLQEEASIKCKSIVPADILVGISTSIVVALRVVNESEVVPNLTCEIKAELFTSICTFESTGAEEGRTVVNVIVGVQEGGV
jgi:hypothetical protein